MFVHLLHSFYTIHILNLTVYIVPNSFLLGCFRDTFHILHTGYLTIFIDENQDYFDDAYAFFIGCYSREECAEIVTAPLQRFVHGQFLLSLDFPDTAGAKCRVIDLSPVQKQAEKQSAAHVSGVGCVGNQKVDQRA